MPRHVLTNLSHFSRSCTQAAEQERLRHLSMELQRKRERERDAIASDVLSHMSEGVQQALATSRANVLERGGGVEQNTTAALLSRAYPVRPGISRWRP